MTEHLQTAGGNFLLRSTCVLPEHSRQDLPSGHRLREFVSGKSDHLKREGLKGLTLKEPQQMARSSNRPVNLKISSFLHLRRELIINPLSGLSTSETMKNPGSSGILGKPLMWAHKLKQAGNKTIWRKRKLWKEKEKRTYHWSKGVNWMWGFSL